MNLVPVRGTLSLPEEAMGLIPAWDYLTIYDKRDNQVLIRSDKQSSDGIIRLEYDGLVYVATPNKEILITFESLINKFKKDE